MIRVSTLSSRVFVVTEILLETFAPPRIATKGLSRIVYRISEEIDLFLHQISDYSSIYILGHTYVGAVCAVRGSKSVIDKYIAKRSQLFAELFAVLGLFCTVTGVLKKDHVAVFHGFYCCLCIWSYNFRISGKCHVLSKKLGQTSCHRRQGKFRNRLSLRLAPDGNTGSPFRRQRSAFLMVGSAATRRFSSVIFPSISGTLKIASYQYSFSFHIDIID